MPATDVPGRATLRLRADGSRFPWLWFVAPYLLPTFKVGVDSPVIARASFVFPIYWPEVWTDKLTDLNFWFLGVLIAHVFVTIRPG